MIVKLQRPLDDDDGPVMVYNRDKSHNFLLLMTAELRALFGEAPKIYAEIDVTGGQTRLVRQVADCDW